MEYKVILYNNDLIHDITLACTDEISLKFERKGSPSTLTFCVVLELLQNNNITMNEGDIVDFYVDDIPLFKGYIFERSQDKDGIITVTAYDQLRYLKNSQSYTYVMKKASEVVKFIAEDFQLNIGELDDTRYVIASRDEDNQTLFDIILTALELTLINTGNMYILYDDFGKLTLKNATNMVLPLLLVSDDYTVTDFSYKTDIDTDTYNRIKFYQDNEDTGKREVYIAEDSSTIAKWGVLQYYEQIDDAYNEAQIKELVNSFLESKNRIKQTISVSGIGTGVGEVQIRGGSGINVKVDTIDGEINACFIVDSITHTFKNNEHTYSLTLLTG